MACLRRIWPRALAASVLPNHFHLLAEAEDAARERVRLARAVAAFARHRGKGRIWEPLPEPTRVADRRHLQRTTRYVLLNPVRAGLVSDPLCWQHTTLRGVLGAEYDPWVPASHLAGALSHRGAFRRWFHAYVAADPRVPDAARIFPQAAPSSDTPAALLADILAAAEAATPWSSEPLRRQAFVLLARHQGWHGTREVARASGISERQVHRLAGRFHPELLAAAALCLGDPRLRIASRPIC